MSRPSPYVFVGGLHRSGTTPLAQALAAHPLISGLTGTGVSEDEGQHLQDVYPRVRAYGGMGRFANSPAAHLTGASSLVTPENSQRLIDSWAPFWDSEKPLLVEKSPANMIMGGFLQGLFPGSALIVIMRHPVAVALAFQKWNPLIVAGNGRRHVTLAGLIRHWLRAHELLRSDARSLERLHVLRYEDLVTEPETELAAIESFLGLHDPLPASSFTRGRGDRYRERWDAMGRGGPVSRSVRRSIMTRYGDAVSEYGYDIARTGETVRPLDRSVLFGD